MTCSAFLEIIQFQIGVSLSTHTPSNFFIYTSIDIFPGAEASLRGWECWAQLQVQGVGSLAVEGVWPGATARLLGQEGDTPRPAAMVGYVLPRHQLAILGQQPSHSRGFCTERGSALSKIYQGPRRHILEMIKLEISKRQIHEFPKTKNLSLLKDDSQHSRLHSKETHEAFTGTTLKLLTSQSVDFSQEYQQSFFTGEPSSYPVDTEWSPSIDFTAFGESLRDRHLPTLQVNYKALKNENFKLRKLRFRAYQT